jgi:DNA-directed RNA polymerase specialized sigma24 family protein
VSWGTRSVGCQSEKREAILLIAWEGLEPTAAARVVGCSAAAFRVRLHRARRRLAAGLGEAANQIMSKPTVEGAKCRPKM